MAWVRLIVGLMVGTASAPATPRISVEETQGAALSGRVVAWGLNDFGQATVPSELRDIVAIAAGDTHSLAVKRDGTVVAWGDNTAGQCTIPAGLDNVRSVAAGQHHSAALKADGTVVAWGANGAIQTEVPAGLAGVTAIAARAAHTAALKDNGTVVDWGGGAQTFVPANLTEVTAVAAGGYHNIALKSDGSIVVWGDTNFGQGKIPPGITGVKAVAATFFGNAALMNDGRLVTWGRTPIPVPTTAPDVASLVGGHGSLTALTVHGTVVGWGSEDPYGLLASPAGLSGVAAIAVGRGHGVALQRLAGFDDQPVGATAETKTFTLRNSGTSDLVITSISLAAGNPSEFIVDTTGASSSPIPPNSQTTFTVTFAARSGGAREALLRLSTDDPTARTYDIVVAGRGLGPEITVSGSEAILNGDATPSISDETDFGGVNVSGAAEVRTFTIANTGTEDLDLTGSPPVAISGPHAADFTVGVQPASTIAALTGTAEFQITFVPGGLGLRSATVSIGSNDDDEGLFHFNIQGMGVVAPEISVEQSDGKPLETRVVAWGGNDSGQTPRPDNLKDATAVAAGPSQTMALKQDGTVVAWGKWGPGALDQVVTVPPGLNNVKAVAAGFHHSVALRGDGSVFVWGAGMTMGQADVPAGLTGVTAIAAGDFHTLALRHDGTVAAWGRDTHGQSSVPAGLRDVVAISAGSLLSAALKNDGRVVTWGGLGFQNLVISPPATLRGAAAIAAGFNHMAALKRDGTVVAWGNNFSGQTDVPPGLAGVAAIAAGSYTTLALKSDGGIVGWGLNQNDQLQVPDGLTAVSAIAIGTNHTVALQHRIDFGRQRIGGPVLEKTFLVRNGGNGPLSLLGAEITGDNAQGFTVDSAGMLAQVPALGSTSFSVRFNPTTTGARNSVLSIRSNDADEGNFSIALAGFGYDPEIAVSGNGVTIADDDTTPTDADFTDFGSADAEGGQVVRTFTITNTGNSHLSLTGSPRVAISGPGAAAFSVTTQPSDVVPATVGSTSFRIAFAPATTGPFSARVSVANDDTDENPYDFAIQGMGVIAPQIVVAQPEPAGSRHGQSVVVWGRNTEGQTTIPSGLTGVTAVGAGRYHTLALKSDGTVAVWGDNSFGQRNLPGGLSGVTAIAAGDYHSAAVKNNGSVVVWGSNSAGQGNVPAGLTGVLSVAAGRYHTMARKADGSVVVWGRTLEGQTRVPAGLAGVTSVAAGYYHSVALKDDGSVAAWGSNAYGQTDVPEGLAGVAAIAAGHYHTVALGRDGTVTAWGRNLEGQTLVPPGLTNVAAVAADYYQTVALRHDGSLVAWGIDDSPQPRVPPGLRPVTALEEGGFHTVALQPYLFEDRVLSTTGPAKTFTIRNAGKGSLVISGIELTGSHRSDFNLDTTGLQTTLEPLVGTTTFAVSFTPGALGARRSTLRILNNDPDDGDYEILLTGVGVSVDPNQAAYQAWAAAVPLTGAAALPSAAPRGDGVPNLLKYAFNLNAAAPDHAVLGSGGGTKGLPFVSVAGDATGPVLRVEFLRRRQAGLVYTPQVSENLDDYMPMSGVPVVTPIDASWERVVIEEPLGSPAPSVLFCVVSVAMP